MTATTKQPPACRTDFSIDAIMGTVAHDQHRTHLAAAQRPGAASAGCQPSPSGTSATTASNNSAAAATTSTTSTAKRPRPKKYQCPYCWVALSNTGQFRGHIRIHTGERPFKCEQAYCQKTFTRNEELTRHRRIHTGQRPYACKQCNKCFGRKDHLKKHLRTHERGAQALQLLANRTNDSQPNEADQQQAAELIEPNHRLDQQQRQLFEPLQIGVVDLGCANRGPVGSVQAHSGSIASGTHGCSASCNSNGESSASSGRCSSSNETSALSPSIYNCPQMIPTSSALQVYNHGQQQDQNYHHQHQLEPFNQLLAQSNAHSHSLMMLLSRMINI